MSNPTHTDSNHRGLWIATGLVVVAALATFSNSFSGPFVFDDIPSIPENASLHQWRSAWHPPAEHGQTVGGRPLLNISFALNYAVGRLDPRGYHYTNLLIHLLAGLTFFGIVRRTLLQPVCRERFRDVALPLATAVAVLWTVHPLQTAAVTYIVQRAESLCGLCYFLTLYAFIRGARSPHSPRWYFVSVLSCLLGMACKEVMVTAPVMVLFYDRAFVSGSWRETWRKRAGLHALLFGTWALLGALVLGTHGRAGSAGFSSSVDWMNYGTTQIVAVAHYLRLAFWPRPLVFDYGVSVITGWAHVWRQAALLVGLAVATAWAWRRNAGLGFLGVWFFVTLAPSSSVVPVATQTMAEHRVYLALAAVVVAAAIGLNAWLGRKSLLVLGLAALASIGVTLQRNQVYRSALALWSDTVEKMPQNARAQLNLGVELTQANRAAEALPHFVEAVRLSPTDSDARNNLANALSGAGQKAAALEHYAEAVRLGPRSGKARQNYGNALAALGRWADAREQLAEAAKIEQTAAAHLDLARVLVQLRQLNEALDAYRAALAAAPRLVAAQVGIGEVHARSGRIVEAEAAFREALRLDPTSVAAHNDLGNALLLTHRAPEAIPELEAALRLEPGSATTHANLGIAFALTGRMADARRELQQALSIDPSNALARSTLSRLETLQKRR